MNTIPLPVVYFFHNLNIGFIEILVGLSALYLLLGLDDLFLDGVAWIAKLRPKKLSASELLSMERAPERNVAIIVPAWKEGNIIDRMLAGNVERIEYSRYHIFVGVYPNDPLTGEQVQKVGKFLPNVHAVPNFKNGPSSKGQILNHVIQEIFTFERDHGIEFDAFLMQDAEDIIHPKVLRLVNAELETCDFLQIPVFSLEVRSRELVAGTYVDEFAESHTKDILVRNFMGAAVPSAGVGTAMSRALVMHCLSENQGNLFNEGTVTEDYELGVRAHAMGFRPRFAAVSYATADGKQEFIATREFFPKRFSRSVRQKTRWTVGIAFQGWKNLGWLGNLSNLYFLARDRKGPMANLATFLGYPVLAYVVCYASWIDDRLFHATFNSSFMRATLSLNVFLMLNRVVQRSVCVARVYGKRAVLPVLARWPLANAINALASFHAIKDALISNFRKASIVWVKTDHELPQYFGQTASKLEVVR